MSAEQITFDVVTIAGQRRSDVHSCHACGAVVLNQAKHIYWHQGQERRMQALISNFADQVREAMAVTR